MATMSAVMIDGWMEFSELWIDVYVSVFRQPPWLSSVYSFITALRNSMVSIILEWMSPSRLSCGLRMPLPNYCVCKDAAVK